MAAKKRTVTIGVASFDDVSERFQAAFEGKRQGHRRSFASFELMYRALTPKRWAILSAMIGQGPLSIREVARRVERDVKAVHGDVAALRSHGLIDKTEEGTVVFPFDEVRVDFKLNPNMPTLSEWLAKRRVERPAKRAAA